MSQSRFERERIAKLFGYPKTKLIKKPSPVLANTPQVMPTLQKIPTFDPTKYLHIVKTYRGPNHQLQIQKLSFRCYDDEQIYGTHKMMDYLKQTYDNDHDTPEDQVKYDVKRGVKKLFEDIQARKAEINAENEPKLEHADGQSDQARSFNSTPPRFIKRSRR